MNIKATEKLSYGLYIVSTWHDGKATGCIINSAMQVTVSPAALAVCVNRGNFTNECIKKSGKLALSVLTENSAPALIGIFGFKSGRDVDKFAGVEHGIVRNMPIVNDCCAYFVCDVTETVEMSTHTVFLCEIKDADVTSDGTPMTYAYYHEKIKGESTKPVSETAEAQSEPRERKTKKYRCKVCGYIYEGESLPNDIVCPICGVGASEFEIVE